MIQKVFGYVNLYNLEEDVDFLPFQNVFGKDFDVYKNIGSLNVNNHPDTLEILLDKLIDNYFLLKTCNISRIDIYITVAFEDQGSWFATPEQIKKLRFLDAVLCVSAYKDVDD